MRGGELLLFHLVNLPLTVVNILGFMGHTIFVAVTQLCLCSTKAAMNNTNKQMNMAVC